MLLIFVIILDSKVFSELSSEIILSFFIEVEFNFKSGLSDNSLLFLVIIVDSYLIPVLFSNSLLSINSVESLFISLVFLFSKYVVFILSIKGSELEIISGVFSFIFELESNIC